MLSLRADVTGNQNEYIPPVSIVVSQIMAKSSCPIHRWKLTRAWNLLSGQRARAYQRAWTGDGSPCHFAKKGCDPRNRY